MTNATTTIVNSTARVPAVAVTVNVEENLSTMSLAHGELVLTFADQTTATLSTRDLSPEILSQALLHGLKQKLVDAAAIARNIDTGNPSGMRWSWPNGSKPAPTPNVLRWRRMPKSSPMCRPFRLNVLNVPPPQRKSQALTLTSC